MDGADEVWVAGERVGSVSTRGGKGIACWGFGLGLVSQKSGCWWRSQMALCSDSLRNWA